MGLLMSLFGTKYKIRFDFTTVQGESFSGKIPITLLNGVTEEEIIEKLKEFLFVETGKKIKTIKITGYYKE